MSNLRIKTSQAAWEPTTLPFGSLGVWANPINTTESYLYYGDKNNQARRVLTINDDITTDFQATIPHAYSGEADNDSSALPQLPQGRNGTSSLVNDIPILSKMRANRILVGTKDQGTKTIWTLNFESMVTEPLFHFGVAQTLAEAVDSQAAEEKKDRPGIATDVSSINNDISKAIYCILNNKTIPNFNTWVNGNAKTDGKFFYEDGTGLIFDEGEWKNN